MPGIWSPSKRCALCPDRGRALEARLPCLGPVYKHFGDAGCGVTLKGSSLSEAPVPLRGVTESAACMLGPTDKVVLELAKRSDAAPSLKAGSADGSVYLSSLLMKACSRSQRGYRHAVFQRIACNPIHSLKLGSRKLHLPTASEAPLRRYSYVSYVVWTPEGNGEILAEGRVQPLIMGAIHSDSVLPEFHTWQSIHTGRKFASFMNARYWFISRFNPNDHHHRSHHVPDTNPCRVRTSSIAVA